MINYHLNRSFKRFPSHYFYVIALVSTGLFWGHTTTVVKASTSEDSTPSTDTTSSVDQTASSTVLRTSVTTEASSTEQNTDGINNNQVIADSSSSNESNPASDVTDADPVTTTTNADDPGSTDTSSGTSTGTSTASVTLTPPGGTLPSNDGSQAVPDTDQTDDDPAGSQATASPTDITAITPDPENTTQVAPDALGVKPVGGIKLNVPIPTTGKDAITATDEYYYTIDGDINITAQLANYHRSLSDVSITPGTWQGSAYAAAIPANAVGIDPKTGKNYVDEWMPDVWFQYLLWLTEYNTQFPTWTRFRNSFSKSSLSTLTNFTVTMAQQQTSATNLAPTQVYTALVQTNSLEGLQYAQNLNTINFTVNSNVSEQVYGGDIQSKLWDISALSKINSLTSVRFLSTSIQDVSALRSNDHLANIELSFNQISDISGFQSDWIKSQPAPNPNDNRIGSSRYNGISMPLLVLKPGTTSVEVSYNVKEYDGSLVHMYPSDGSDFSTDYPETYEMYKASTADAVSENDQTIVFYNFKTPPAGDVGWLSAGYVFWEDGYPKDPSAFDVWVSIPYIISDDYGTTKVNYENLLTNGQQEEVATSTPLSGSVGDTYDISSDSNTTYPLEWLIDKYGSNYLVLNGTGNYSDYLANNGLAQAVPGAGTYTADPQNLTVLFAPTSSTVTVQHGYYDADHQFVPLSSDTTVDQSSGTSLNVADQATPITNFHYTSAEIVAADGTTTPLSNTTTVPYLTNGYQLRLLYAPDPATINFTYKDDLGNILPQSGSDTGTAVSMFSPDSKLGQIDIPDYTFDHYETSDGTPITTSMTYPELQAGLTLVYKGNTLPFTVSYVDNHGNVIHITAQASGAVNAKLTSDWLSDNQLSIPDYTFDRVETTADHQTISADATINTVREGITYVYAPNSITIPIHYLNSNVDPVSIAADDSLDSPINENVTTEQITAKEVAIKYYTFKEARDNAGNLITFPSSAATIREGINLIYDENRVSVPISYVDPDGNPLLTSGSIDGFAAHQLTPDQIATITGYTWKQLIDQDKNPVTLPINFGDLVGKQLTAVYEPIQVSVPVDIVNSAGIHLADFPAITGNYLDELTADMLRGMAPSINGYSYSTVQDAAGNALTLPTQLGAIDPQGIKLVYSENNVLLAVHYVDPDGNPLGEDSSINGSFNQSLSRNNLLIPEFTGYTAGTITDSAGNAITFPTTFGAVNGDIQVTYQPVRVTIPVQIVDATDKPIGKLDPIQITGNYLDQLTDAQIRVTAPSIKGYTYSAVEDSTGSPLTLPTTLGAINPAGIKLVYNENDVLLTVHYVDPAGNALSEALPLNGKFSAELNLESLQAPEITGYTAGSITDETGHPITLPTTFGTVNGDILVHYQPVQVTIPVQYVDTNNNTIAEPQQAAGNYLDTLSNLNLTNDIIGYTFKEIQDTQSNVLPASTPLGAIDPAGIKFIYTENEAKSSIKYIDAAGNELHSAGTISNQPSQQLTADEIILPAITGYTFDHFVDGNLQPITLPLKFAEIISNGIQAVYAPVQVAVTVNYVDENGKKLADPQQARGNYLDQLTADQIAGLATPISGYTFVEAQYSSGQALNLPVQFGTITATEINLVYRENTVTVPIQYVDLNGEELLPSTMINHQPSEQLSDNDIAVPAITGYTFDHFADKNNATVSLPIAMSDIIANGFKVVYKPVQVSIPVQLVDTTGKVVGNSQLLTGDYLDSLTNEIISQYTPTIDGYTFTEVQDSTGDPLTLPAQFGTIDPTGIKLVYFENQAEVTIKYVDPQGTELHQAGTISHQPSQQLTADDLTLPTISGYTFDHFVDNTQQPITLPVDFSEIIANGIQAVYEPIQVTIPVQYVDDENNPIAESSQISANYLDELTPESITQLATPIDGYTFDTVRDAHGNVLTLPIQFGAIDPAGIKLLYTEEIEGTVTTPVPVTYVDSAGNQLLPAINIEMESDQQITANRVPIPDVPGYQFAKLTDHAGNTVTLPTTLDAVETGLRVVYQPIQVSLPVSYVDTEGRVIANQQRTSGNYLDQLTTGAVAELATPIDGYTFVEAQDATGKPLSLPLTLGTLTEGIKLVYRANEVPTDITVTINYVDPAGNHIQPPTNIQGGPDDLLTAEQVNVPELPGYVFDHFEDNNGNPFSLPINFSDLENGGLHVVYQPIKVTVPVYYLDDSGQTIATAQQVPGNYQDPFTAADLTGLQQTIPGYQFSNVRLASGEALTLPTVLGELQTGLYLIYTVDNTNVVPPETPDTTPPAGNPGDIIPEKVPVKVIYAMKEISLHTTPNFTNDNIVMTYVKKPRIYRPRFMVIDTVRDSQNRLRYLVRDINSKSDTYSLMGYITANPEDVRSAYYHIVPTTITVINPKGINGYKNTDLTGKVTHYRQGTVLKIARILKDKTATRFVLTNGQIVTASKLLVKMGTIPQPKRATKLKALNRYGDLDLTTKLEHFKKVTPKSFGILNWDYSDGYNYHVKSLKRYKIDNGYITAYSKLVKSDY